MKKKNLGQFFTTNSQYIIGNLLEFIPKETVVVDPFAGNWDMLNLIENEKLAYDIDPKNKKTIKQDTLTNPPNYEGKYVITNPPYLASNKNNMIKNAGTAFKAINEKLFKEHKLNDLYKIAIKTIEKAEGGILIIPVNFFCEEISELRQDFLSKYKILKLNIFEETVFEDTSYPVCSFAFKKSEKISSQELDIEFFPSHKKIKVEVSEKTEFKMGHQFITKLNKIKDHLKIKRLIYEMKPNSNLFLRALDSGTLEGRINLSYREELHFDTTPNKTDRAFCTLVLPFKTSRQEQEFIANEFNKILEFYRKKYNSLFLPNFRNSTEHYSRKRMGFDMAYKLVSYIILSNADKFKNLQSKTV